STAYSVGGFNSGNPPWDFGGSGSNADGTYNSEHIDELPYGQEGVSDDGNWTLDFTNSYQDTMNWSAVTVTLHKQALPECENPQGVAWLSITQGAGTVNAGQSVQLEIEVDGSALPQDPSQALLCLTTDDPLLPLAVIQVTATLSSDPLFDDRFED
ncbi:MAG: hypothetical protein AAGJ52_07005, partial [Pseudomonadota bacterium]